MFDRIAGVYDPMNTAMTAGLHHRWRARAADLAHVGPGSRVLDVATGTGDLAIELARRVAPGRRGRRQRLRRGHARPGPRARPPPRGRRCSPRFEWADAMALPYARRLASTPPRSASARATSTTSAAAWRRWSRVVRPGGRVVVLEITTPTRAPLSLLLPAVVRPARPGARAAGRCAVARLSPARGGAEGTIARRLQLPARTRSSASPAPPRWPPSWSVRACRRSATCSPPAASWPSTRAPSRTNGLMSAVRSTAASVPAEERRRTRRDHAPRRQGLCAGAWSAPSATSSASPRDAGTPLAAYANATVVAGGKRLRPLLVVLAAESAGGARRAQQRRRRGASGAGGRRGRARAFGDARPRRHHRRRAAAPRPARPWRRSPGRQMAVATGDLLFSRAFAELARNERRRPAAARSRDASSALAEGELLQREDAYASHVAVDRYLQPLRAEDRRAVRGRLPARRADRGTGLERPSPTRSAPSRGASGWPFRCSMTCWTSPGRWSGPASRGAPTCSTAPSRCRSSSRASATRTWPRSTSRSLRGSRGRETEALCERIAATGALDEARERALAMVAEAKAALPAIAAGRALGAAAADARSASVADASGGACEPLPASRRLSTV